MDPVSLLSFLTTGHLGLLRRDQTQEQCFAILGEPEDRGGTSRKQPQPTVFKYGDLQLLFERPGLFLTAALVDISSSNPVFRNANSARSSELLAAPSNMRAAKKLIDWVLENEFQVDEFQEYHGVGFRIENRLRVYTSEDRLTVESLEMTLAT